jgi:hypothetical protein
MLAREVIATPPTRLRSEAKQRFGAAAKRDAKRTAALSNGRAVLYGSALGRTGLSDGRQLSRPSTTVSSTGPVGAWDGTAGLAEASGEAVSGTRTTGDSVGRADGNPVGVVVGASDSGSSAASGAVGAAVYREGVRVCAAGTCAANECAQPGRNRA